MGIKIKTTLLAMTLSLVGCGKEQFKPSVVSATQQAPGHFVIPPKIDFLLLQDDTAGISELRSEIEQQMPGFLQKLAAKGWDFHFSAVPLTRSRNLGSERFQIATSRHDLNWKITGQPEGWTPTYPGAPESSADQVSTSYFARSDSSGTYGFRNFLTSTDVAYAGNAVEKGLMNLDYQLNSNLNSTGFLRDDAMLIVMVVGNGEDTSGVNNCTTVPGQPTVPCKDTAYYGSLTAYGDSLQNLKRDPHTNQPVPQMIKFVAAVSPRRGTCRSGSAFVGERYRALADRFGGLKYNICDMQIGTVLDQLDGQLTRIRQAFTTTRLFIPNEPEVSSIKVTKYVGGSTAVVIPQDSVNGWTYRGHDTDFAIESPVKMNENTGYIIELHGTARLTGDDRADVDYLQKGARPSGG